MFFGWSDLYLFMVFYGNDYVFQCFCWSFEVVDLSPFCWVFWWFLCGFCHCKWLLFLVAFHNCCYCYRQDHRRQRQRQRRRRRRRQRRRWWQWCNDHSHNSKTLRKHQKNHKWLCLKIGYHHIPDDVHHHFPYNLMLIYLLVYDHVLFQVHPRRMAQRSFWLFLQSNSEVQLMTATWHGSNLG